MATMFTMQAPNGQILIARDELQKQVMEREGFVLVQVAAETKKPKNQK